MKKRENFYRRDPSKALAGMVGLSLEERGVYNTVIDLLYYTWRPLEDDRAFIAGWCGCAVQKVNPIINRLIEKGRLITFTEGARTFLSDEAFEAERTAVKGAEKTRSGRADGGEKSAGVEGKSAGVDENQGLLDPDSQEKQPVTPLDKNRVENGEANASPVPPAAPPDGEGGEKPKARARHDYPEAFEAAWRAYPHHEGRSSKPNSLARWKKLPADEQTGLVDAIERFKPKVGSVCGGKGAPDMAVWLGDGKHLNWMEPKGGTAHPAAAWAGPPDLRARIVAAMGDDFARGYLDRCEWREEPTSAVVAPNTYTASRLRTDVGDIFDRLGVGILAKAARVAA